MNSKKTWMFIWIGALLWQPARPWWDEVPRSVIAGTVTVIICGVTFLYWTSGSAVYCKGCKGIIRERQARIERPGCGHIYHYDQGCYAPNAECQECLRKDANWRMVGAMTDAILGVYQILASQEAEKQRNEAEQRRAQEEYNAAQLREEQARTRRAQQTQQGAFTAQRVATAESANAYPGTYVTPEKVRRDQQEGFDGYAAVKAAQQQSSADHGYPVSREEAVREQQAIERQIQQQSEQNRITNDKAMMTTCKLCGRARAYDRATGALINYKKSPHGHHLTALGCCGTVVHTECLRDRKRREEVVIQCPECVHYTPLKDYV